MAEDLRIGAFGFFCIQRGFEPAILKLSTNSIGCCFWL